MFLPPSLAKVGGPSASISMAHGMTDWIDAKPTTRAPLRVGIILSDHFTLSAFALFIDHLRLAADEGDRSRPVNVQWSIMASRPDPLRASCGVMTTPTSNFLDPRELDYVVIVGGILHAGRQIDDVTERYLRRVASVGFGNPTARSFFASTTNR